MVGKREGFEPPKSSYSRIALSITNLWSDLQFAASHVLVESTGVEPAQHEIISLLYRLSLLSVCPSFRAVNISLLLAFFAAITLEVLGAIPLIVIPIAHFFIE